MSRASSLSITCVRGVDLLILSHWQAGVVWVWVCVANTVTENKHHTPWFWLWLENGKSWPPSSLTHTWPHCRSEQLIGRPERVKQFHSMWRCTEMRGPRESELEAGGRRMGWWRISFAVLLRCFPRGKRRVVGEGAPVHWIRPTTHSSIFRHVRIVGPRSPVPTLTALRHLPSIS
jgi:hypothetical protein